MKKAGQKAENTDSPWTYTADSGPAASTSAQAAIKPVKWTASEFIEHDKGPDWYILLALAAAILAALIYLIIKDLITVVMVIIAAVMFGIFAARKPRVLEYQIDEAGVHVGSKLYPFSNFKSFAVVSEDSINSIWLMPLKRFMPILTIYFAPNDGQKIINTLGGFLPIQSHQPDTIDQLMHRLRF